MHDGLFIFLPIGLARYYSFRTVRGELLVSNVEVAVTKI